MPIFNHATTQNFNHLHHKKTWKHCLTSSDSTVVQFLMQFLLFAIFSSYTSNPELICDKKCKSTFKLTYYKGLQKFLEEKES